MSHNVNDCPDTKFLGGLSALHLADEEAIAWLGMHAEHTLRRSRDVTLAPSLTLREIRRLVDLKSPTFPTPILLLP